MLLTVYTDGALGKSVVANFSRYDGGSLFEMEVTSDHETYPSEGFVTADGLLRYLTRTRMPQELVDAAFLGFDRAMMADLDSIGARAATLTMFERLDYRPEEAAQYTQAHWKLNGELIQQAARSLLDGPRIVIEAAPLSPLPKRARVEDPAEYAEDVE